MRLLMSCLFVRLRGAQPNTVASQPAVHAELANGTCLNSASTFTAHPHPTPTPPAAGLVGLQVAAQDVQRQMQAGQLTPQQVGRAAGPAPLPPAPARHPARAAAAPGGTLLRSSSLSSSGQALLGLAPCWLPTCRPWRGCYWGSPPGNSGTGQVPDACSTLYAVGPPCRRPRR